MTKKILITGAGGFIGSHLAELCVQRGYRVRAFVRYNSMSRWGWLESSRYKKDIEVVAGDIRDYDSVVNYMKGCDTVFHLAALVGIPYSYISPLAYIRTNIEGTYNILQAGRELKPDNIVLTSTSETYGTAQYVPIDEKHPLVGQSPYAASKIAADQLGISYYRSFGLPVKIARPFNTYGPRQSARAIIPAIIIQLLNARKEIRLGNTAPTRDLTYVKDTAEALIEIALSKNIFGEVTNIGSTAEISIGDLAETIALLMKKKIKIIKDKSRVRPKDSEVERLCCDNEKIKVQTRWRPRYTLQQGLSETISWLKENYSLYKADLYNV